jgi:hypothetical protein
MFGAILAAALTLAPRPLDLVKPGEEGNYAVWLEGQARKAAGYYAHKDCASATLTPEGFEPVTDDALAKVRPGAALYVERLKVEGCGVAQGQGLIVLRERTDWRALPTAPGESRANLALQREVLPSVILTVKDASDGDRSCSALEKAQSALIYDTRITRAPSAAVEPWSERWFMSVCGAGYKVDIDFTPTAGRTDYVVRIAP